MNRVLALVEGKTERNFGQLVLAAHFGYLNIDFQPRIIGKYGHKGGVGPWARAKKEIVDLIRQEPQSTVTTMFDHYGLPDDWPGRTESKALKGIAVVELIEERIEQAVAEAFSASSMPVRFIPYIQRHEFEALLFSDTQILAAVTQGPDLAAELQKIVDEAGGCEEINDRPQTAPSWRLKSIVPIYQKVVHGIRISERIELATMRSKCPHFDSWLRKIELIGNAP